MVSARPPAVLLRRSLELAASPEAVWAHLARVEAWPAWARHLRSARLEPAGAPLGPESRGVFVLKPGLPTRFAMTSWDPPRRWKWHGRVLWLRVGYDHRFEPRPGGGTLLVLEVDATGSGSGILGRLFARVYARNLDRALPRLAAEFAEAGSQTPAGSTGSTASAAR